MSVGGGEGVNASVHGVPTAAAPAGTMARVLWVQVEGDASFAPLVARDDMLVGFLIKGIKKTLELPQCASSLSLHLAGEDGKLFTAKGVDGMEQPVTLNNLDTVDQALEEAAKQAGRIIGSEDKLRVIVHVAAPAAAAVGACAARELCSGVWWRWATW